ncbi:MAG: [FeFe] hydrogenase H-cluster radical SAM maturase HydE, partial [Fibrobacteres bacterium]|nr:[FeFe] hydrogenase H-cluster radical SAM maturase HydE [Fibrobacterota bacterium]
LKYLLALNEEKSKQLLYKTANFLRQKHQQNSCCVHGIIELSNRCIYNCSYCGIGAGVKGLPRYKMSLPEVMEAAGAAIEKYGFKVLVLQTGDGAYSVDELIEIIQSIKAKWPCLIFISAGETGVDSLEKLWNAGARGILMRFETSNSELYATLHPGMDFNTRLTHLRRANELGYLILTGSLIGVPGQTEQDIINDIRLAKELNAEMFSFGPFLPSPGTPLAENSVPDKDLIIKTLAVARLIDPEKAKILITTALETLDPASREKGLMAGGNSVMLNVTPMEYRKLYSIYPNRAHAHETITEQINVTIDMLKNIGRAPTDLSI